MALENLSFNTFDLEKVQGKRLGCITSQGDTSPTYCTPTLQRATAEGWKSRMRLVSRGVADPWPSVFTLKEFVLVLGASSTEVQT